jgi:hypothetical protein
VIRRSTCRAAGMDLLVVEAVGGRRQVRLPEECLRVRRPVAVVVGVLLRVHRPEACRPAAVGIHHLGHHPAACPPAHHRAAAAVGVHLPAHLPAGACLPAHHLVVAGDRRPVHLPAVECRLAHRPVVVGVLLQDHRPVECRPVHRPVAVGVLLPVIRARQVGRLRLPVRHLVTRHPAAVRSAAGSLLLLPAAVRYLAQRRRGRRVRPGASPLRW